MPTDFRTVIVTDPEDGILFTGRWYYAADVDAEIARLQQQVTDLQRQLPI